MLISGENTTTTDVLVSGGSTPRYKDTTIAYPRDYRYLGVCLVNERESSVPKVKDRIWENTLKKESVKLLVDNPALSLKAGAVAEIDVFFVLRLENGKAAEAWIKGSFNVK